MMMLLFSLNLKGRGDWNLLKNKIIPSHLTLSITFKQKTINCFKILKNKLIQFNIFQAKMKGKLIKAHGWNHLKDRYQLMQLKIKTIKIVLARKKFLILIAEIFKNLNIIS